MDEKPKETTANPVTEAKPSAETKPAAQAHSTMETKPATEAKPTTEASPSTEEKSAIEATPAIETKPGNETKSAIEANPAAAIAYPPTETKPSVTAAPEPEKKNNFGTGKKVMIVDDDPGSLKLLQGVLESVGFEVMVAANGKEGLKKVKEGNPLLIIADVLMPEMDGYSFFKELKNNKDTERIPVFILTVRKNMVDSFLALGATGFIPKPIDSADLLAKISALPLNPIEKKSATKEEKPKT